MSRREVPNVPDAFRKDWHRWTNIVELTARRHPARPRVDSQDYQRLHNRITSACRELAGSGDEAGRKFYEDLEAEVRPWLSPRALVNADSEILTHLLSRCREIERHLEGRASVRAIQSRAVVAFSICTALTFAVVTLGAARGLRSALVKAYRDVVNDIRLVIWRSTELEKWSVLGVILILISIYNVSKSTRN